MTSFEPSNPLAGESIGQLDIEHTPGSDLKQNPRQFLEKKGYTDLELNALNERGNFFCLLINRKGFFSPNDLRAVTHSNREILDRICYGNSTIEDVDVAFRVHNKGSWVLTTELRTLLFSELYVPMLKEYNQNTWQVLQSVSVSGRVRLVHQIERFCLQSLCIGSKHIPNLPKLEYFIHDAICLIHILKEPSDSFSTSAEEAHPFYQFKLQRNTSWRERWNSSPELVGIWTEYVCGLCDAIFGLWPASGQDSFHARESTSGCIGTLLRAFVHEPREPSMVSHLDYHCFDAAYIESRGPFQFKPTTCIDDHLLLTERNEILFYPDWEKWSGLTSHSVLHSDPRITTFDILMCTSRRGWRPQPLTCQIRVSLSQVFGDLATTGMLCFFQKEIDRVRLKQEKPMGWRKTGLLKLASLPFPRRSSAKIGKYIGMSMAKEEILYARAFLECCSYDWARLISESTLFRTVSPFKDRVDKLYKALNTWKPRTVWEMRYPGYGGVDPVQLYGFYFATALGIAAIIGLAATIAQTFAAFKGLHVNTGGG